MSAPKTVKEVTCVLLSLAFVALPVADAADTAPPFSGTVWVNSTIIDAADPSSRQSVTYRGRGQRQFYDFEAGQWEGIDAYLFDVQHYSRQVEYEVHPDSGDLDSVREFVDGFAETLGRVPRALLSDVREVELHARRDSGAANPDLGIVHWGRAENPWVERDGWLEEVLFHEGTHVSLDPDHLRSPGWIAAREADGAFISDYARDYPDREDLAETLLMWFAVRYRPERLSTHQRVAILNTIPNRLIYLDELNLDMAPYTLAPTSVPALPAALTLAADTAPAEGGGEVTVTATLDEPAPADDGTTVTLTTGGTATLDADYTLSSSTITIAEGETEGTATIAVIDDAEDDDGETIVLDAESVNPALTAPRLTLTIEDNDEPEPVPALPVGGALLLGALLLWRGAVRAPGRGAGRPPGSERQRSGARAV